MWQELLNLTQLGSSWIIKFNLDGSINWQREYGNTGIASATASIFAMQEASDGNIILVGSLGSAWVFKISALDGEIIWHKRIGINSTTQLNAVVVRDDDRMLAVGFSTSGFFGENPDGWAVKMDTNDGRIVWQKSYGNPSPNSAATGANDYFNSVQAIGNDWLVGGFTDTTNSGIASRDAWILKINDANGSIDWQRVYGGTGSDSVLALRNGWTIAAGKTDSFGAGEDDAWMLKISETDGSVDWQKTYGSFRSESISAIQMSGVNGIIAAGAIGSYLSGEQDALLFKVDLTDGQLVWSQSYGGSGLDYFSAVQVSTDDTIVTVGQLNSPLPNGLSGSLHPEFDAWLLKLTIDGQSMNEKAAIIVSSPDTKTGINDGSVTKSFTIPVENTLQVDVALDDQIYQANIISVFEEKLTGPTIAELEIPTGFTVSPTGNGFFLTWLDQSNELGYRIFRSVDGVNFTNIRMLPGDTASYDDGLLPPGTYQYKMVAFNASGYSDYSVVVEGSR